MRNKGAAKGQAAAILVCALTHSFSNPSKQIPLLMKDHLQASLAKMAKANLHGKTSIPDHSEPFALNLLFLLTSPSTLSSTNSDNFRDRESETLRARLHCQNTECRARVD